MCKSFDDFISYGTPPVKLYHIVDTGSELSWIQCLPCIHCFPSDSSPFSPENSSTFLFEKCPLNKTCPYETLYEDNAYSRGELATDTITVGSGSHKRQFKNFLFGCGHENTGHFPHKSIGIVGFNLKQKSFITQLHTKHHGTFSYCMTPPGSTHARRISSGHEAIVSGDNVMTTPLILDSYYNIMLKAITVGKKKIKYFLDFYNFSSKDSKVKNIQLKLVVDSGSTTIYLPNSFYSQVERAVIKYIKRKSPIGAFHGYSLCYLSSLRDADIPKIKLHFPGVVLELSPVNTFVQSIRHRCLAILHKLGNMAQINFLVGFDIMEKKIAFKPTNRGRL